MWVMKLELPSEKQFIGKMALKHKVSVVGQILSYYKDSKKLYLIACGFMFGPEKNKDALIRDVGKQKEYVKYERKKDFMIAVIEQPLITEAMWDPRIIRITPNIINWKDKKHVWNLASFDKALLMSMFKLAKKFLGAKILKLKEEKISNISVTNLLPELTKKQKEALELAINNGYYNYPKKIKMEKLAKIQGCSYSTYQAHLKKAEGKLLPNIYREL